MPCESFDNVKLTTYGDEQRTGIFKGVPYGKSVANDPNNEGVKFRVVNASQVECLAGILKSSHHPGRYYHLYPEMIPADTELGDITQI